ncbi:valine--tRNA ligase [Tepidicaulis sp. LMO-SS28]|uniref:valine--tRNA ligase n=1 Tax=Tepidicaulis sp. LMO-SS28 TaxID=3447455 RepID=UPI003EDEFEE6
MLDKTYQPQEAEARLYREWEERGAFRAGAGKVEGAPGYSIVIPPPNVTGSLHMGHALNNTLQDVLVRFERMRGKDVLWQPGTDHAGIATQMVVERQLAADGGNVTRHDMGREAFVERIWQWKAESGGTIVNQLRRLGASCDWSRERFTMDEGLSEAVLKVFVDLYREGLIYKDKRLVNWDPKLLTAISDLEVVQTETKGHFWHFRYPVEGEDTFIIVATTRPETMLGDTAVAVNPEDERYKHLIGKHVILPLVGRRIPIVADEYADPEQGSGAVKITPAHDFNDFEVGRRHDLEMINIFDSHARINENAPEAYQGLDRFEARKRIVADMEEQGFLAEIEDHTLMVPHGDRSDAVIEPWLTDQWYVDAATLAKPAIEAVESGKTRFVPKNWEKTYFEWMRNIQPWCISRQLWWGHQIPAWYGPDGEIFVAHDEAEARALAEKHYGKAEELTRDPDVLDTWFSSALWPFSTLGWPEETAEQERYFPTSVLITGFDIIFFWVARMMMMSLHFKKEIPFHEIYIHALVRDEKGQKMSKSKGNVIDPLELVDEYGADALRFTLAAMAAQGRDIKLAKARVEGYRNFGTKLWNAARFCEMNECARVEGFDPASVSHTLNRWIAGEAEETARKVTQELEAYRFNEAAGALYRFVWNVFCDWYVEFAKPLLNGEDEAVKTETRATAAWTLDQILKLLHPFMPFLTEELWQRTGGKDLLMLSRWPAFSGLVDEAAKGEMDWVIRFITEVRSVRSEMNVPAGAKIPLLISGANEATLQRLERNKEILLRLARLESAEVLEGAVPKGAVQIVLDEAALLLPLADVIDLSAEMDRLKKEIDKLAKEVKQIDGKLSNENFVSKAPAHVVEEHRERRGDALEKQAKLKDALTRLESVV